MVYIKSLTIQGLKSYRDQTQIEPFSPRHNVVVGRNGSGKSNFFAAIRFVLSDAYTSLTREERQALLHEGVSTTSTLSAYVEIIFDNSDNRFPTGHDELILRRTIGIKKDEYSLDKKSANKAEVMNLLESAGFSKSNPYYIVPQGRITALTNAKDTERLALLKEVAGTKVYEQRRTESLRIMSETDAKRTKINELLDYINSRLTELEEEKEELKEFQEKDKDRRCLEYALFQRELEEVGEALEDIEQERRAEVHGANQRREKFNEREKEIQDVEQSISDTKHSLETITSTRQDTQDELTELIGARTELDCTVKDLQSAGARAGGRQQGYESELSQVEEQIKAREGTLSALLPDWESTRAKEASERRAHDDANTKLEALFAKRGRGAKFRTKSERDAYLRQEITSMDAYKTTQGAAVQTTKSELQQTQKTLSEVETQISGIQNKIDDGRQKVKDLGDDINRLKEQKADLVEKRKDLWREDSKLDKMVTRAVTELKSAERVLAGMMDKDTGVGLGAVDKIAERNNIPGVYGPLYRLFEITDQKYNIAIELTAGNSLFHVVVDNDETASKVLEIMLKEKTGRVTFMPLNRLKPTRVNMPNAQDAIPILSKMEYDPKHDKAFQQVFGKTCVCRDLHIAAEYVKTHSINTITLDGDRVDRKGALTGGYHDVKRSRIEAIKNVTTWRSKWEAEDTRSREVKASVLKMDQEIAQFDGRIQVLDQQIKQTRESRERLLEEGTTLTKQKEKLKDRIAKLERDEQELEVELSGLDAKLAGYQQELQSPLTKGLTDEEEEAVIALSEEVEKRRKELIALGKSKNKFEGKKNAIEIELNERLRRRRDELKAKLDGLGDHGDEATAVDNLESKERELRTLNKSIQALTQKTQAMEEEIEGLQARMQKLRSSREALQTQQTEDSRNMSRQQKTTERYLAKRQMLAGRKDECNRNIRDLGVLPEEAFEKYTGEKLDRLMKKLHTVRDGLQKFAHVNKKAFEQYSNFTKQRDQLLQRREDLDKSAESIEELVQVLDQRKDEAIERTFKQVASNFEEVFEKLVPAGRGRLIIQRRIDQDEEVDEDVEETQQSTIDNYTGVSIKVSFNSKVDEGLRIQQLSGGQKSLVALATVFAIQKCDPAPFYLFDEIDANLDAQYRTAVAAMIKSLASSAQFITTTFRPEMLVTADKFYGVLFNNQKVSSIRAIKREEAMEFVDQEAQAQ
ncbi:Structural maintenance of chromosomes protein [Mycena indigotica]|uniref:Structural maintenance of chromosomes protein n=1 Tax=Mycena indigotica TaxID=2126181 RepID=A0A8H6SC22_9AGAR|nr:Structural maintenance of chromosomes protein [Mycena indigotica]KAF7295090.1 Structural maintenance of chromosomes protein [Mycena indigotica]